MKRFNYINFLPGRSPIVECSIPSLNYSELPCYVDKSRFVPMSKQVKSLRATTMGSMSNSGLYDYPDGKDDGKMPSPARDKRLDMAELSALVKQSQDSVNQQVADAELKQRVEQELNGSSSGQGSSE